MQVDEVIAKLEAAAHGSRLLDSEIAELVAGPLPADYIGHATPYHFTTSLDAALTLVLTGWGWLARSHDGQPAYDGTGTGARGFANVSCGRDDAQFFTEFAATPALALCIAALKARSAA